MYICIYLYVVYVLEHVNRRSVHVANIFTHTHTHTGLHIHYIQASLNLDQSLVSLLERADLDASDDLAFEYMMSISDFAFTVRASHTFHTCTYTSTISYVMYLACGYYEHTTPIPASAIVCISSLM